VVRQAHSWPFSVTYDWLGCCAWRDWERGPSRTKGFIVALTYSIIIPAHNEADCLPDLLAELQVVLDSLDGESEILVIDDGSTDATVSILQHWSVREPRLRWVSLNGNFGQSAAFDAGFRIADGAIFITLDADGQNPPTEIPGMLAALSGCDMVCGWRLGRKDHWTKYLASKFANTVRRGILHDGIHDSGCSLKVFRREAVGRIKLFHGLHRFLPALVRMEGFRVREVRVAHRPRCGGKSHYGILNRILGPLMDLLVVSWMKHRSRRWRINSNADQTAPPIVTSESNFPVETDEFAPQAMHPNRI
jgi:dolichol-phosphate mannosyltransferase